MKLQLNTTGAWRNVVTVELRDEQRLRELAHQLGCLAVQAGDRPKFRILGDFDQVLCYWNWDKPCWQPARRHADGPVDAGHAAAGVVADAVGTPSLLPHGA